MIWKERMVAAPSYVKTRRFLSDQKTMMKSNFKKSHFSDVIVITSPKNVTQLTPQEFSLWPLLIKISGYTDSNFIRVCHKGQKDTFLHLFLENKINHK